MDLKVEERMSSLLDVLDSSMEAGQRFKPNDSVSFPLSVVHQPLTSGYLLARSAYSQNLWRNKRQLCKLPGIQQRLAHLRGYMSALEAVLGLVLTVPYGLLVGRLGECLLGGIDVIGYLLSCAWILIVCYYWTALPIWTTVLSPLFRVIGGGSPFLSSLIYAIAAKHVPESKR